MNARPTHASLRLYIAILASSSLFASDCLGAANTLQQPSAQHRKFPSHMTESGRASVKKVVLLPTTGAAMSRVDGDYGKVRTGVLYGAAEGIAGGVTAAEVMTAAIDKYYLGQLISVAVVVPAAIIAGAIIGAVVGGVRTQVQKFRDDLTIDLADAANPPLRNDVLARDVYSQTRHIADIDTDVFAATTPLAPGTDAVLLVQITDLTLLIDKGEAVITTWAKATLRSVNTGKDLYVNAYRYEDRDTLRNWTSEDNALWRDYSNFARHYFSREISEEFFQRVELRHVLRPTATVMVADSWQNSATSANPTLEWELVLLGDDMYSWANKIDEGDVDYDLEMYDAHRLVYFAKDIGETQHAVAAALEECQTYRWTVRPTYRFDGKTRVGEWMRYFSAHNREAGHLGTKASQTPAFTSGFAQLRTVCGRP